MDTITKTCAYCNQLLVRKLTEKQNTYKSRRYCNRACAGFAARRERQARIPMLPFWNEDSIAGGMKRCSKCDRSLPLTEFGKDKQQTSGLKCWCKRCRKLDTQRCYRQKKSTVEFKKASRERSIRKRQASYVGFLASLFSSARNRAKRSGFICTIVMSDVVALWEGQAGKCYYSGEPMTWIAGKGKQDTNASLERLNPADGYTPGNVVLCCYFINVSKRDKSIDEWLSWADKVRRNKEVSYPENV